MTAQVCSPSTGEVEAGLWGPLASQVSERPHLTKKKKEKWIASRKLYEAVLWLLQAYVCTHPLTSPFQTTETTELTLEPNQTVKIVTATMYFSVVSLLLL